MLNQKLFAMAAGFCVIMSLTACLVLHGVIPQSIFAKDSGNTPLWVQSGVSTVLLVLTYGTGSLMLRLSLALRSHFTKLRVKKQYRLKLQPPTMTPFDVFTLIVPVCGLIISFGLYSASDFSHQSLLKLLAVIAVAPGYATFFVLLSDILDPRRFID